MTEEAQGGRVFFSNVRRSLEEEDEIRLVSVGVDIGSSTSHLVFSRLVLERLDNRYIVSEREVFHESDVLLTPYADDMTIDAGRLGAFIDRQYEMAGLDPQAIDTGALILTGVAVRRANSRAIGDLFAAQTGKFVSVSAGDGLETTLAAFGSGAAARSIRESNRVMNIDIGGGTSKIAVCESGEVAEMTAVDVGARIISFNTNDVIERVEEAGRRFAKEAGFSVELGSTISQAQREAMVEKMADRLFEAISQKSLSAETADLLRLNALQNERKPDAVTFSGGVSEYVYGLQDKGFGDLGPLLARAMRKRIEAWGVRIEKPDQGIRATVVGASQYTIQVSGSTIFVSPLETLPLRNVPVVVADTPLDRRRDRRRGHCTKRAHCAAAAGPARRRTGGGALLPLERFGHLAAAGGLLHRCEARSGKAPGQWFSDDPCRRWRHWRTDRHSRQGRAETDECGRVHRRHHPQGV